MWSTIQDILYRVYPTLRLMYERRKRVYDPFQIYVLPFTSLFFFQFFHLALGFKILTLLPLGVFYTRLRDKTRDPDMK